MTLQKRLLLIILLGFTLAAIFMFALLQYVILPTYNRIELAIAQKDLRRAKKAIHNEINHLNSGCHNWSSRDETYEYILNKNRTFEKSNLIVDTYVHANFDMLYILDKKGNMIWGKVFDTKSQQEIKSTKEQNDLQELAEYLVVKASQEEEVQGVVRTELHTLLIVIRKVLKSDESGTYVGWMIMGRFLTPLEIDRIALQCQVPFSLIDVEDNHSPLVKRLRTLAEKEDYPIYSTVGNSTISSHVLLFDLLDNPSFLLSTDFEREISSEGREHGYYAIIISILIMLIILFCIMFILQKGILNPLQFLLQHMREIVDNGDYSLRISETEGAMEIVTLAKEFNLLVDKVDQQTTKLAELAVQDGLTGLHNRRSFDVTLENEWERLQRVEESLCLILCDIDFFKAYNDTYGHQAGDIALINVAQALEESATKPTDFVARYGGEEFVIILANTSAKGGAIVAERIREHLLSYRLPHSASEVADYITISCGVAAIIPTKESKGQQLLESADKALYRAKKAGRNGVVIGENIR